MPGALSDISLMSLWLAGAAGQASLARSGDSSGLRALVDQHAAEVRDALGGRVSASGLMSYARGFVEAAVARGWWPPDRMAPGYAEPDLDWESLRLAAVCRLHTELMDSRGHQQVRRPRPGGAATRRTGLGEKLPPRGGPDW
jgi:uncharacterized protein DUF6401